MLAVFTEQNAQLLKSLPPPMVAAQYYCGQDLYMYQSFIVSADMKCRKPKCETMYDMFQNIIDDEVEHKKTMQACQNPADVARQIAESAVVKCDLEGKPIQPET
jgi:ubiquinol oxidase